MVNYIEIIYRRNIFLFFFSRLTWWVVTDLLGYKCDNTIWSIVFTMKSFSNNRIVWFFRNRALEKKLANEEGKGREGKERGVEMRKTYI